MPLSVRRQDSFNSQATIPPPNRSPGDPQNDHVSIDTSHQFWLADLKANEALLALQPGCPCTSSSSPAPCHDQRNHTASPGADMHYRAAELASITERFRAPPAVTRTARGSPTRADLIIMSRLSRDIASSLAEATRHHRRREGRGSRIVAPSTRDLERLGTTGCRDASGPREKRASSICLECQTNASPQWRRGPDGAGTLCNVCGLLYARRERRRKLAWRRGSSPDLVQ